MTFCRTASWQRGLADAMGEKPDTPAGWEHKTQRTSTACLPTGPTPRHLASTGLWAGWGRALPSSPELPCSQGGTNPAWSFPYLGRQRQDSSAARSASWASPAWMPAARALAAAEHPADNISLLAAAKRRGLAVLPPPRLLPALLRAAVPPLTMLWALALTVPLQELI